MKALRVLLKYEFFNVLRNKWVFLYAILLAGVSVVFLEFASDSAKAVLSLMTIVVILVPLIGVLFSTVYWYHSERYTELLLTQPIRRRNLFFSRWLALSTTLSAGYFLGVALPFLTRASWDLDVTILLINGIALTTIFVGIGLCVSIWVLDRMKGIGIALFIWFYFAVLHDGLLLLFLLTFREYPLEIPAVLFASLNPLDIARVLLLATFDTSALMGHTGGLVLKLLSSVWGYAALSAITLVWITAPVFLAARAFERRDF